MARQLFDAAIGPHGLLKGKTRLLATHHLSFLSEVDQVVVLKNGVVEHVGDYETLSRAGLLGDDLFRSSSEEGYSSEEGVSEDGATLENTTEDGAAAKGKKRKITSKEGATIEEAVVNKKVLLSVPSKDSAKQRLSRTVSKVSEVDDENKLEKQMEAARLIEDEEYEVGQVSWRTYGRYIRQLGLALFGLAVAAEFCVGLCEVGANYWLSHWTSEANVTRAQHRANLNVYIGVVAAEAVAILVGSVIIFGAAYRAAIRLHRDLLHSVLRAPLVFFDTTPIGRILNRFSRDMSDVDDDIPMSILQVMGAVLWLPFIYVIVWIVNRYLALFMLAILTVFYVLYVSCDFTVLKFLV